MFEAPLDDDYYPDTPQEEAKLERISELEHLIDEARSSISGLRWDISQMTDAKKIQRVEDIITGYHGQIDDWEFEIRELEDN